MGDGLGLNGVGDMGDKRIEARPALGLENRRHGLRIAGVGGQTIDGLCGQND